MTVPNRQSHRLRGYDNGSDGAYFVTIVTKNRINYFGNVTKSRVFLSDIGNFVIDEWFNTENIRSTVKIGESILMPNHLHGIIFVGEDLPTGLYKHRFIPTGNLTRFSSPSKSLGAIIRGFKGSCTNKIKRMGCKDFAWHNNYYDKIVRNQKELMNIENYIKNNPYNWKDDDYFCT